MDLSGRLGRPETQSRGQPLRGVQLIVAKVEHLFCFGSGSLLAVVDVFVHYPSNTAEAMYRTALPSGAGANLPI